MVKRREEAVSGIHITAKVVVNPEEPTISAL